MARNVDLIQFSLETLQALAAADLEAARLSSGLAFGGYFISADWLGTWQRRASQLDIDPQAAPWITRAILDAQTGTVVGRAGFHGPPDPAGMVEVGYAVDPQYRRQGYARAALTSLVAWAGREAGVLVVRACVRPDNLPSLSLVESLGFTPVGEQWDDEDGLEIILERLARPAKSGPPP